MARKPWPTIPEVIADTERGILDDSSIRVQPSAEERAAVRAEAEAFLAERRVAHKQRPSPPPAGDTAPSPASRSSTE